VLTLIEKAEATFDAQEAEKTAEKMMKGEFTLEDFLSQFQQVKKMGPLQDLLSMLPGASSALRNVQIDDKEIKRVEAIIYSMTPEERRNPKIMNGSRKRRVAAGSGTTPQDVNKLLRQFADTQKLMKGFVGKGLAGLAGLGGGRRR